MSEYSVEEVRARFEDHHGISWESIQKMPPWSGARLQLESNYKRHFETWQAAYASHIEADESAVPVAWLLGGIPPNMAHGVCLAVESKPYEELIQCFPPVEPLFIHPPAQAARVDQVGELLAIIHGDGGHYQAEHGLQKAAKDAQEKVIQMMTRIATAEPVAQPAESGRVPDGWVLVPREPTEAMLDAAMAREDDEPLTDWGKIIPAPHAEIYKAMIAAATQPGESA